MSLLLLLRSPSAVTVAAVSADAVAVVNPPAEPGGPVVIAAVAALATASVQIPTLSATVSGTAALATAAVALPTALTVAPSAVVSLATAGAQIPSPIVSVASVGALATASVGLPSLTVRVDAALALALAGVNAPPEPGAPGGVVFRQSVRKVNIRQPGPPPMGRRS